MFAVKISVFIFSIFLSVCVVVLHCPPTFMFMTAWAFEAHQCHTLQGEIMKTKRKITTTHRYGISIVSGCFVLR
jgi:accessory gene regulator protein AgrB